MIIILMGVSGSGKTTVGRKLAEELGWSFSALKASYRETLRGNQDGVVFVYLKADPRLIAQRLEHRAGHYAKRDLLPSQLATLEEPEGAITVDASRTPTEIAVEIRGRLGL